MADVLTTHALTTLAAAKDYLQAKDSSRDGLITRLINAASEFIEKYCDRHFEKAAYTEKYRGNNRQRLLLNQYPVVSVTSIEVNGSALAATDFEIEDAEAGMLYRESGWPWKGYAVGLVGEPAGSIRNIKSVYVAGYVLPNFETPENPRTLPYNLELACWLMIQYYYKTDIANFSTVFAESGAVFKPVAIPSNVKVLLDPFKRRACL